MTMSSRPSVLRRIGIFVNAITSAKGTPLTNLHLTLLDRLGVPVEHLGDSTGELPLLADV